MEKHKVYIYGKHAVAEALLHAPDVVNKIFLAPDMRDGELTRVIEASGVSVARLQSKAHTRGVSDQETHQGVFASISVSRLMKPFETFIKELNVGDDTALLMMGEIIDPQNVGALIRSAAAFGVAGVLMPQHRQAQVTGAVVKASAGTAFRVPLVSIGNPGDTLGALQERGFRVYGLDTYAKQSLDDEAFDSPAVFVLGNEARGLAKRLRQVSDVMLSIPMSPHAESLNVAASGAVVLHVWSRKHPKALK